MQGSKKIADRLAKLEALFARGATEGERAAAGAALERLQTRLDLGKNAARAEPETELQYSLPDVWALRLFIALCRKAGVRPYRYARQRRTTVMVRVRKSEFERTVMAEFNTLHRALTGAFGEIVDHLIADAMQGDGDDATLDQPQIGGPS
jgi:hypothetical protein